MREIKLNIDCRVYKYLEDVARDARVSVEQVIRVALVVSPHSDKFNEILGADEIPVPWAEGADDLWIKPGSVGMPSFFKRGEEQREVNVTGIKIKLDDPLWGDK